MAKFNPRPRVYNEMNELPPEMPPLSWGLCREGEAIPGEVAQRKGPGERVTLGGVWISLYTPRPLAELNTLTLQLYDELRHSPAFYRKTTLRSPKAY